MRSKDLENRWSQHHVEPSEGEDFFLFEACYSSLLLSDQINIEMYITYENITVGCLNMAIGLSAFKPKISLFMTTKILHSS